MPPGPFPPLFPASQIYSRPGPSRLRSGPRPLWLHLMAISAYGMSLPAAFWRLNNGLSDWNRNLPPQTLAEWTKLIHEWGQQQNHPALQKDIQSQVEAQQRLAIEGILRYRAHPYLPDAGTPPAVIGSEGSSRLLSYRKTESDKPLLLVIPSLVNQAHILDLDKKTSFVRTLADRGYPVILLDWGTPGPLEQDFSLSDYISRLLRLIEGGIDPQQIVLVGYCMGGLLALAAALALKTRLKHRNHPKACISIATPWDFSKAGGVTPDDPATRLWIKWMEVLGPGLKAGHPLPAELLQAWFAMRDPMLVIKKFSAFAQMDPSSEAAHQFVALEDWAAAGVPMAGPAAYEALQGWYIENQPFHGKWEVNGKQVKPGDLNIPALCLSAQRDRIVPAASSGALAAQIPHAETTTMETGHVGMMAKPDRLNRLVARIIHFLERSWP